MTANLLLDVSGTNGHFKGKWMRGPGYKRTGDVRRTWRCPQCGIERKSLGDITTRRCGCQDEPWMQLVIEHTNVPRPFQRPSDLERHPIDFGIEPPPPAPRKPEATIIKPAVSLTPDPTEERPDDQAVESSPEPLSQDSQTEVSDEWGEGIL